MKKLIAALVLGSTLAIQAAPQIPIANDFTGPLINLATNGQTFRDMIGVTNGGSGAGGSTIVTNNNTALRAGVVYQDSISATVGTNTTGLVSMNDTRTMTLRNASVLFATNATAATTANSAPWAGITGVENVLTNDAVIPSNVSLSAGNAPNANSDAYGFSFTTGSANNPGGTAYNGGPFTVTTGTSIGDIGTGIGGPITFNLGAGTIGNGIFTVNGNSLFNGTISDPYGILPQSNLILTNGGDGSLLTGVLHDSSNLQTTNANLTALAAGTLAQNNAASLTNVQGSSIVGLLPMGTVASGYTNAAGPMLTTNNGARYYTFNGNALTNLAAASLVGTIPSALLPAMNYVANTNGQSYGQTNLDTFTANGFRTIGGTNFSVNTNGNGIIGAVAFTNGAMTTSGAAVATTLAANNGSRLESSALKLSSTSIISASSDATFFGSVAGQIISKNGGVFGNWGMNTNLVVYGTVAATNGYILPPIATGPAWSGASNNIIIWCSNSIPPTEWHSYFNGSSNRVDFYHNP